MVRDKSYPHQPTQANWFGRMVLAMANMEEAREYFLKEYGNLPAEQIELRYNTLLQQYDHLAKMVKYMKPKGTDYYYIYDDILGNKKVELQVLKQLMEQNHPVRDHGKLKTYV